jgi:hypothetical protein
MRDQIALDHPSAQLPASPRRRSHHGAFGRRLRALLVALPLLGLVPALPAAARSAAGETEDIYNSGQDALAAGRFDDAASTFRDLASRGVQVDRALYWQAYAEAKAARKKAALATLRRLQSEFASSPWIDDAQALEVELKGVSDPGAVPSQDEELKLYALNALHNVQPEKAVKLLEDFLRGQQPLRLKRHALFVLAQIETPRAAQLLLEVAKGGGQFQALQQDALQALGTSGDEAAVRALVDIYKSSTTREAKSQILQAMVPAEAKSELVAIIRAEKDPELLEQAIETLGVMDGVAELEQIAGSLPPSAKEAYFRALGIAGDGAALMRVVRAEKDPKILIGALEALVMVDIDNLAGELEKLYRERSEPEVKRAILNALFVNEQSATLLSIFRSEKDRELRQEAFQFLTLIEGDPATDKLLEETLRGN